MNKLNSFIYTNPFFFLFTLFLFNQINAQKIEKFYDYKWKDCAPNAARFYTLITKIDSGYTRKNYYIKEKSLQSSGLYEDSLCKIKNGEFIYFHPNGKLLAKGIYKHDKKDGMWLSYHNNGEMSDSTVYFHDKQIGKSLSWYPNGFQRDSIYSNKDESGIKVSWFDNGFPSSVGAYSAGKKQNGEWKYYHKNGSISAVETYKDSKLIDEKYFDEKGILSNDTIHKDRPAQFEKGIEAWQKYIANHIYFPDGYKLVNTDKAIVVVTFTVNEDGTIENVFTSVPFDKNFDEIAVKAIKNSPKWMPGIDHNRRVKYRFNQVVSFNDRN